MSKVPTKKIPRKPGPATKKENKLKKYSDLLGLAVTILLGIIVYSNSFNCSFHFDDLDNIVNNTSIHNLSDVKAWWNYDPHRPVAIFTFALNYHFSQLNVWGYHFVNLIIHLINSCLVWWLIILILSSPAMKDHAIAKQKKVIALFAALLFVSHPLATQSVTYIVQRMASLVAMFYMLSLALYVKARLIEKGNKFKYLLFAASFLSAVLAMLTKENAFTLPFAILLFEFFFIRTKKLSINFKDYRVILLIAAFLGVILIIPLKFSFSIFKPIPPMQGHDYTVTAFNYLLTQFSVLVKYIQLLLLPVNQMLDYNFTISNNFFGLRTFLCFMVLLTLIILAVFLFKKYRIISFGIFWFFLTSLIESSIIPLPNVIFEHRTYLPSFGFFLILSSGVFFLFSKKYKYLVMGILVIITGTNSFLTIKRNTVWENDITLWTDDVEKAPDSARPITNRGVAYGTLNQWDKAIEDYTSAIKINPKFMPAYVNRGIAYTNLKEWDKQIADYTKVIEIDSTFVSAYYNRGIGYGNLGKWNAAIADFSTTIRMDPNYSNAYYNLGVAYGTLQQWDKAITNYSKAVAINPGYTDAYSNRAALYTNFRQWDKAIDDYTTVIRIDPNYNNVYFNRGIEFGNLGEWDKAVADYSKNIEINPDFADAYYNRGIAFSNLMEWDKAIADYSSTLRIAPKFKQAYVNRGIAYGHLNQWNKAIEDYNSALAIDPNFTIASINRDAAYKNQKR